MSKHTNSSPEQSRIKEAWKALDVLFDGDRTTIERKRGHVNLRDGRFGIFRDEMTRMHRWLKRPIEETIVTERMPKTPYTAKESLFDPLQTVATRAGQLVVADQTYTPINWRDGTTANLRHARAVFITKNFEDMNTGSKMIDGLQFDFTSDEDEVLAFSTNYYTDSGYRTDFKRTQHDVSRYLEQHDLPTIGNNSYTMPIQDRVDILRHCVELKTGVDR